MSSDSESSGVHRSHKKRKKEKKHKKHHSYDSEKNKYKRRKDSHKDYDVSSNSSSSKEDSHRKRKKHEHSRKKRKHSRDHKRSKKRTSHSGEDHSFSDQCKTVDYLKQEKEHTDQDIHIVKPSHEDDLHIYIDPPNGAEDRSDTAAEIASLTNMLLEKFQAENQNKDSSLAKEVYDLMNMIANGEVLCIDGISDERLRMSMEKLFLLIGLIKEEMDESEPDDENQQNVEEVVHSYGYALPDESDEDYERILLKLNAVIGACKAAYQKVVQSQKRTIGPMLPPSDPMAQNISAFDQEDSEDDEIGPAPLDSVTTQKRTTKNMSIASTFSRQKMSSGVHMNAESNGTSREEWMIKPGEHDFLSGILAKGIKSRGFRNDKSASRILASRAFEHLDPKIQKEVDEIKQIHQEARGPSLMEQHREKKAEEKANKGSNKDEDWSWSRDKHLDAGRRVDKSHLRMVMGGASSDLKNKFQGGYGRD